MRGETRRKARRRIRRRSIAARIAAKTTGATAQGAGYHPRPKAEPPKAVARGVRGRDPEHRAELDQRCHARLCFGPKPSGTHENETSRAGLRPEDIYVYVERSQGRANRPFLVVSPEREARVREADALAGVRARLPETKPHDVRQTYRTTQDSQQALRRNEPRRRRESVRRRGGSSR